MQKIYSDPVLHEAYKEKLRQQHQKRNENPDYKLKRKQYYQEYNKRLSNKLTN